MIIIITTTTTLPDYIVPLASWMHNIFVMKIGLIVHIKRENKLCCHELIQTYTHTAFRK